MVIIWNTSCENASFFNCYYISIKDMHSFFGFLVSLTNHYHINGLHLFWDSFEWFSLQISSDAKYFSSFVIED